MKANKKLVMAASFFVGATMFVTTAFADIASKTGYDQLKDSVKFTVEGMSEKLQSFTVESILTVKDNNEVLFTDSTVKKVDNAKGASESYFSAEDHIGNNNRSFYSYQDSNGIIWHDDRDDIYYISEVARAKKYKPVSNPFEESRVKDLEKILDALIGDLKNFVVVEDKADGSKELSGKLNEGQIPALVNAVSSFLFKQSNLYRFAGPNGEAPSLKLDDVFVKSVSGRAFVNKDGIMENILATGVLSGKDESGVTHDIAIEALIKVYDINSTLVSKPNLEGKTVQKSAVKVLEAPAITAKYVGKYSNDIVIVKDDSFIKIGERVVEITSVDDKNVSGRYYETYEDGYTEYSRDKMDFLFDGEIQDAYSVMFKYTDSSGREQIGNIHFDSVPGKIYFFMPDKNGIAYDGSFSRVFDK